MENKINIAELLKNCPSGMELDCTIFENLEFDRIDKNSCPYSIICRVKREWGGYNVHTFTEYGCYSTEKYSKCVIFPKGKTTWDGFVPLCNFKDGDVCYVKTKTLFEYIFIFKVSKNHVCTENYVTLSAYNLYTDISSVCATDSIKEIRLATEEEKQKLFNVIKENGYKWNAETKTLEKLVEPKFKVGDKIKQIGSPRCYIIKTIEFDRYILNNNQFIRFGDEHIYELVPNKFDITTLIPFESRVLVRNCDSDYWKPAIFGFTGKDKNAPFCVEGGNFFNKCIPYEGNEHLLSTREDCNEYYKNW